MFKTDIEKIKETINLYWNDSIVSSLDIHSGTLDKEDHLIDVAGLLHFNNEGVSHLSYLRYKNEDIKIEYQAILYNLSSPPSNVWDTLVFEGKNGIVTITGMLNLTNSKTSSSIPFLLKWMEDNNLQHRFLTDKDTILNNLDKKDSTRILLESSIPDVRNSNYNRGYDIAIQNDNIYGHYLRIQPINFRK